MAPDSSECPRPCSPSRSQALRERVRPLSQEWGGLCKSQDPVPSFYFASLILRSRLFSSEGLPPPVPPLCRLLWPSWVGNMG